MTEPYPPPTPEERQLRAQRLAASGGPPPGPPVANPLSSQAPGGGLRGQTAGVPNYVWLIGIVGIAVVGFILWRKNQAASSANNSTITAANPNSPVDASTAGLATDQYESLLALLRDQQGAASQILTTEQQEPPPGSGPTGPTGPAGPAGPTGPTGPASPPPPPAPTPTPTAPPSTPKTYRVVTNDTLSSIATRFGTSWQTLYNMNKNVINNEAGAHGYYSNQWDHIWPGEVLVVP